MSSKSLSQETKDAILNCISVSALTANQILDKVDKSKVSKQQIQNLLYTLENIKTEKTDEFPPRWSLIKTPILQENFPEEKIGSGKTPDVVLAKIKFPEKEVKKIRVIIVDLGNVHDCLNELDRLDLKSQNLTVYALANKLYNGYGINPKCFNKNILLHQYDMIFNGATDIEISHMFSTLVFSKIFDIIIVSKSKKISQLIEISRRTYIDTGVVINLKIVESWDSLQPLL